MAKITEIISIQLCSHPNRHKTTCNLGAGILIFHLLTLLGPNLRFLFDFGVQWVGLGKIMELREIGKALFEK